MAAVDYQQQQQYREELEDAAEGMRQSGHDLGTTTGDLFGRLRDTLQPEECSMSAGPLETPTAHVENVMSWTALMLLLGGGVASAIGAYVLGPVLGLFFNRFGAGLFAFVVFPVYELYMVFKNDEERVNAADLRFRMLSLALTKGLLAGYTMSNYYLSSQPLMCLTPFVVAYAFPAAADHFGYERRQVFGISLAAALLANVALGLVTGYLGLAYLTLSVLYVTLTGLVLEHMMHNVHSLEDRVHLYHVCLFTGMLVVKAVIFGLFGTTYQQLQHQQQARIYM